MARLIVKSPYIKCGGSQGADAYMRYIATRERVEIIPDDRPPTRKQEQLITKLIRDFPDVKELLEYDDYVQKPTKANASSLITLALEEHWKQVQQTDGYMKYIATRPRAERLGDHGLFGDADHVDLDAAMSELEHYTGNMVCSKQLFKEALGHTFDEPKRWQLHNINEIMNTVVTGWKPFSNPRMFAGYGRQKGWERDTSGNELPSNEGGFVELSEEECRQLELPQEWIA